MATSYFLMSLDFKLSTCSADAKTMLARFIQTVSEIMAYYSIYSMLFVRSKSQWAACKNDCSCSFVVYDNENENLFLLKLHYA